MHGHAMDSNHHEEARLSCNFGWASWAGMGGGGGLRPKATPILVKMFSPACGKNGFATGNGEPAGSGLGWGRAPTQGRLHPLPTRNQKAETPGTALCAERRLLADRRVPVVRREMEARAGGARAAPRLPGPVSPVLSGAAAKGPPRTYINNRVDCLWRSRGPRRARKRRGGGGIGDAPPRARPPRPDELVRGTTGTRFRGRGPQGRDLLMESYKVMSRRAYV